MKKLLFILTFCLAITANTYSQSKQELIRELFTVMQTDSVMDKTFASVFNTITGKMITQAKDSLSRARAQEMMKVMVPAMKEIIKRMRDEDLVSIYDRYFTESEIKDFIAFYKTPSGQKLTESQPAIQKDLTTIMIQKYIPEIQRITKEKIEEIKAKENKNGEKEGK